MTVPTVSWDETSPAGSASRSQGDDRIREMKTQIREVIAVDHEMDSSGQSATTGYHNKVTFIEQASSPSMVANTIMLFCKEASSKSELYMDSYDATLSEQQLTENGNWIAGIQYEVRMFSGLTANIPTGWVICDGTNDTPTLTDKFVRCTTDTITTRAWTGAGAFGTGGADSHTHTNSSHTHTGSGGGTVTSSAASGTNTQGLSAGGYYNTTMSNHTHTVDTSWSFTTTGPSALTMDTISNIPAYVELAFIMKS